jgi:hypothetical protein
MRPPAMRRIVVIACALLLAACARAWTPHDDGAALPRKLQAGERVLLKVELGAVGGGKEIVVRTPDGALIGTVSPHGIRHGTAAGTYLVPVPAAISAAAIVNGRLRLRFLVEGAGAAPRPARADEVRDVQVVIVSE